ncbi:FHA domain-containing protein [bacterium]|nr:MAG: FHA domain-containing protein [bacterium]
MPPTVTLEITNGSLTGREFDFSAPTRCLIGRGKDCTIQIPDSYDSVSRHHCVLEINPPNVRVKDLESLNGTYLGGECIGRRERTSPFERILKDGDELVLGQSRSSASRSLALSIHTEAAPERICAVCGHLASVPSGAAMLDKFVCATCRVDSEAMRRHLEAGDEAGAGLSAIANYELLQKIGRGGFGSVFLARHRVTGRRVALKVMLPHIAGDPMMRQVFEREIENMKALHHPHVVELFEDGSEGGVTYFTMEYCALGSVSSWLKKRGSALPVAQALELIFQAIDGLHYAHHAAIPNVRLVNGTYASGNGLVHRDIKPCNLLLDEVAGKVVVKVGDYGMSKVWEQAGYSGVTRPGTRAGSFAYQPRQQVRGYRDSQPEVDVWAMAATLYFMLTGSTPRDFPPHVAPELVVLQQPVVEIRERNPDIPQRLADAIDSALIDDPNIQVKDIAAFRRSLELAS